MSSINYLISDLSFKFLSCDFVKLFLYLLLCSAYVIVHMMSYIVTKYRYGIILFCTLVFLAVYHINCCYLFFNFY